MKKALSYMMIGALTSATVFIMLDKGKNFDDLKREKRRIVEKFKAMM